MHFEEFDKIDSWLDEQDIERMFAVVDGLLPDVAVTDAEIVEFQRVVNHAIMIKNGGSGYQGATLQ